MATFTDYANLIMDHVYLRLNRVLIFFTWNALYVIYVIHTNFMLIYRVINFKIALYVSSTGYMVIAKIRSEFETKCRRFVYGSR